MGKVTHYMAHDPISNTEGVVTEFDQELINRVAESGIIFIAVDESGERSIVEPDDVTKPVNEDDCYVFVQPQYVDERTQATVAVFDALASSVPAVASNASVRAMSDDGGTMSFADALEALRLLAYPNSASEGGAQ